MRIKLNLKIFSAFLVTYIMSSILMISMIHFYASWNFVHFMDKVVIDSLDNLVSALALMYEENGSWMEIRQNSDSWDKMTASSLSSPSFRQNFPLPMHGKHRGEPAPMDMAEEPSPDEDPGPPLDPPPFPPPKFLDMEFHIQKRLSLFDSDGKLVAGNAFKPELNIYRDIVVNDEVVGRIGLKKNRRRLVPPEIRFFLNQQLKMFSIIGAVILIMCALVSYILTNHLMAPIRRLIQGTHAVTNLKFDTRIKVFSRDELGQLAQDFNLMAKTLERYEQMQRQWISDIAHELRTPLSIMRGEIEALQDGIRKYSPSMLDSLHDEVMNLAKTVGDLHELSLADSGALHFDHDPVAPVAVLKNTLDHFQTRFKSHKIKVIDRLPDLSDQLVLGDGRRLKQLFANIFENAIRYGNSPGTLLVSGLIRKKKLELCIEDSGPGVPQKSLERIFDRLYRVDFARSRSGEGSGLGLSICKMVVAAHSGTIRAETGSMGGLKIIIRFPLAHSDTTALKEE